MASKLILAVALISTLLPYLSMGQTVTTSCTNAAGCPSACCVINRQTSTSIIFINIFSGLPCESRILFASHTDRLIMDLSFLTLVHAKWGQK